MMTNRLMTPDETATYLGVSVRTLGQWRWKGTGPVFVLAGRLIRYRLADLEAWAAARTRKHTGDPGPVT